MAEFGIFTFVRLFLLKQVCYTDLFVVIENSNTLLGLHNLHLSKAIFLGYEKKIDPLKIALTKKNNKKPNKKTNNLSNKALLPSTIGLNPRC